MLDCGCHHSNGTYPTFVSLTGGVAMGGLGNSFRRTKRLGALCASSVLSSTIMLMMTQKVSVVLILISLMTLSSGRGAQAWTLGGMSRDAVVTPQPECTWQPDPGSCRGFFRRYYYDQISQVRKFHRRSLLRACHYLKCRARDRKKGNDHCFFC